MANRADHATLVQQRHPEYGSSPSCYNLGPRELWVSEDVRDMHDSAFERRPPDDAVATGDNSSLAKLR